MKDYAHEYTDEQIAKVEKKLKTLYNSAMKEVNTELEKIEIELARLNKGNSTAQQRVELVRRKNRTEKVMYKIAEKIQDCNQTAIKILNNENLNVYSENYNYSLWELQNKTGLKFSPEVFNQNILKQFVSDNEGIFNEIALDNVKDFGNIKREVEKIFFTELMKGSSMDKIVEALQKVVDKNHNKLISIVRTTITRIENSARYDGFKYGEKLGLNIKKTWIATLDGRTRKSHRHLDGESTKLDEPFSNGLMFPGGDGSADEVVNCRCAMTTEFVGIEKHKLEEELDEKLKNIKWNEWRL